MIKSVPHEAEGYGVSFVKENRLMLFMEIVTLFLTIIKTLLIDSVNKMHRF